MSGYAWDGDRSTFPVLMVGARYRHKRFGEVRVTARLRNTVGCRYAYSVQGRTIGEQNDWALLSQLATVEPEPTQLEMF